MYITSLVRANSGSLLTKEGYKMWTRLKDWYIENREKRIAHWQLRHMSDETLKDIGLTRDDIYRKIYG